MIIGKIDRPNVGSVQKRKALIDIAKGPASNVTIAAGATGTIELEFEAFRKQVAAGISNISGLPTGVYITSISIAAEDGRVTLGLINTGTADVTIESGSVTATVVAIA